MNKLKTVSEVRLSHSIFMQLSAFALFISILPVLFISGGLLHRMETMTERELTQSYQWLVSEHVSNAKEKLDSYRTSLSYTASNSTILDALTQKSQNPYALGKTISTEIFKTVTMESHQEILNCILYAESASEVYGSRVTMLTEADEARWRDEGWNGGEDWFLNTSWQGRPLISCILPLNSVNVQRFTVDRLGLIRMDLYLDRLFAPAENQDYQVLLTDSDGKVCYASQSDLSEVAPIWLSDASDTVFWQNYVVMGRTLSDCDLTVIYLFQINEITSQKAALKHMIYPVVALTALLIIAGSYFYYRRFAARVQLLLEKFRRAATGDLTPTAPIGGEDEITVLDRRFGEMLCEIDTLNRQSSAQQAVIREARYRNLQLQINPHFLYNTLETISAIAATHQVFQICDLCEKLGDIFRYSLGKNEGRYTPVARELKQTQNYIFIQQVRYQFEVFYSIEVDAEQVCILRFLLQPIVENAILHGLSGKGEPGTLEVYIGKDEDRLEIRISDDGIGMDTEQLQALRTRLNEPSDPAETGSNIGLWNISQRIRLSYGERGGMEVYSKPGQGTTVTLHLPYVTRGMIENEAI